MKKYLIIVFSLLLGLSCSVKEVIYDTLTSDNSFQNQTDVVAFVNGTYSTLNIECYKNNYLPFFLTADDIYSFQPGTQIFSNKSHDATNATTGSLWRGFFKVVNQANFVLDKIDGIDIDSAFKVRTKCEMKFLRAFAYFNLVRIWGPVPLRTTATNSNKSYYFPRVSIDSVYSQIFVDLLEAKKSLYNKIAQPSTEFNHATKGAAFGYLAKAYQAYGNYLDINENTQMALQQYQLSEDYCDSVLLSGQYSLASNVKDLFDVAKERDAYSEVLFGIAFTRDAQVASAGSLGSQFAGFSLPGNMPNVAGAGVNKTGVAQYRMQPWFVEKYTSGDFLNDFRGERFFATNWTNTSKGKSITFPLVRSVGGNETVETAPYLLKYIDGQALDSRNGENDFFALRLADIILTKAEMENEINGASNVAYTEFNKIRTRARAADGITSRTSPLPLKAGLSKEAFRLAIVDERALEFVGEGLRWFDLCRMKSPNGTTMLEYQLNTVIPTYTPGLPIYNNSSRSWGGGRTDSLSLPPFQIKFLLMPIPLNAEISLNPNIGSQNPGYN